MTRDQLTRTLQQMERIRLDSYEAETPAEERRLTAEYGRLWKTIEAYVTGRERCSDDPPAPAAAG
jgi:hypothetical protein